MKQCEVCKDWVLLKGKLSDSFQPFLSCMNFNRKKDGGNKCVMVDVPSYCPDGLFMRGNSKLERNRNFSLC